MPLVEWNEHLSVGNAFMDSDHRHLIGLLNKLHIAIGEGKSQDVLGAALHDLVDYTREHFKREETLMQDMHYDGFPEHQQAHRRLMTELLQMQKNFMAGETRLALDLLQFLFDRFLFEWLVEHTATLDRKLALAIQGAAPAAKDRT